MNVRSMCCLMPAAGRQGTRRVTKFGVRVDGKPLPEGWMMPGLDVFVADGPEDKGPGRAIFSLDQGRVSGALRTCPGAARHTSRDIREGRANSSMRAFREGAGCLRSSARSAS